MNLGAETTFDNYDKLGKEMENLDVSILVNNAGILECHPTHLMTKKDLLNMFMLNAGAPVLMT